MKNLILKAAQKFAITEITRLASIEENISGYAATEEKYLFVDGLLMDNGVGRSDRNRDMLESLLCRMEDAPLVEYGPPTSNSNCK